MLRFNKEIYGAYQDVPKLLISWMTGAHTSPSDLLDVDEALLQHVLGVSRSPHHLPGGGLAGQTGSRLAIRVLARRFPPA